MIKEEMDYLFDSSVAILLFSSPSSGGIVQLDSLVETLW